MRSASSSHRGGSLHRWVKRQDGRSRTAELRPQRGADLAGRWEAAPGGSRRGRRAWSSGARRVLSRTPNAKTESSPSARAPQEGRGQRALWERQPPPTEGSAGGPAAGPEQRHRASVRGSADTRVPVAHGTGRRARRDASRTYCPGRLADLLSRMFLFFSQESELNLGEAERLGSSRWVRLGPLTACRFPGAGPSPLWGGGRRQRRARWPVVRGAADAPFLTVAPACSRHAASRLSSRLTCEGQEFTLGAGLRGGVCTCECDARASLGPRACKHV